MYIYFFSYNLFFTNFFYIILIKIKQFLLSLYFFFLKNRQYLILFHYYKFYNLFFTNFFYIILIKIKQFFWYFIFLLDLFSIKRIKILPVKKKKNYFQLNFLFLISYETFLSSYLINKKFSIINIFFYPSKIRINLLTYFWKLFDLNIQNWISNLNKKILTLKSPFFLIWFYPFETLSNLEDNEFKEINLSDNTLVLYWWVNPFFIKIYERLELLLLNLTEYFDYIQFYIDLFKYYFYSFKISKKNLYKIRIFRLNLNLKILIFFYFFWVISIFFFISFFFFFFFKSIFLSFFSLKFLNFLSFFFLKLFFIFDLICCSPTFFFLNFFFYLSFFNMKKYTLISLDFFEEFFFNLRTNNFFESDTFFLIWYWKRKFLELIKYYLKEISLYKKKIINFYRNFKISIKKCCIKKIVSFCKNLLSNFLQIFITLKFCFNNFIFFITLLNSVVYFFIWNFLIFFKSFFFPIFDFYYYLQFIFYKKKSIIFSRIELSLKKIPKYEIKIYFKFRQ